MTNNNTNLKAVPIPAEDTGNGFNLADLTDDQLVELGVRIDRARERAAERERVESARLNRKLKAKERTGKLEAELAELKAALDERQTARDTLEGQLADALAAGDSDEADELLAAVEALDTGLEWAEGHSMHESTGALGFKRVPLVPPKLEEALPNVDWTQAPSTAMLEERIAKIEAELSELERKAA